MMAINHAMTGALLGLTVDEPALALPLAFLSHFALDIVPHYDQDTGPAVKRIKTKQFLVTQILLAAILCFLLVVVLVAAHPARWLQAAICAFLGTSPDLLWIPRFVHIKRTGRDVPLRNWFWRFHDAIQWRTGPQFLWLELFWLAGTMALVVHSIHRS